MIMTTEEINKIINEAPQSWDDINVETFQELLLKDDFDNWIDTFIHNASILCNLDPQDLESWNMDQAKALNDKLVWANHMPKIVLKNKIIIDGLEYKVSDDYGRDLTFGQWLDLETYTKNGTIQNMHKIFARLYFADGEPRFPQKSELFKKVKIMDVYAALVFFWSIGPKFTNPYPVSSQEQEI